MGERKRFDEICEHIQFRPWDLECWDCMRKTWLQYWWNTKWLDWKCSKCGYEWKDIWLLRWNFKSDFHYPQALKEIIFSPQFRDHLYDHLLLSHSEQEISEILKEMIWHLYDPTKFLYHKLKIWKKSTSEKN